MVRIWGIDRVVRTRNYRTALDFAAWLDAIAQILELPSRDVLTAVVFPAHIGSPLFLADEWAAVTKSETVAEAVGWSLFDEKAWLVRHGVGPREGRGQRIARAFLARKAPEAAEAYRWAFSEFAARYGVTVVAGSIALPGADVKDGKITVDPQARWHEVGAVFGPDGTILPNLYEAGEPAAWARKLFEVSPGKGTMATVTLADVQLTATLDEPRRALPDRGVWAWPVTGRIEVSGPEVIVAPALNGQLWEYEFSGGLTLGGVSGPAFPSGVAGVELDAGGARYIVSGS